jgi:biopolymer transport protein ExbD
MKRIILVAATLLIISGAIGAPNAEKNTAKASAAAVITVSASNSQAMDALLAENKMLTKRLEQATNTFEELISFISYDRTMEKTIASLRQQRLEDQVDDLKAEITFGRLMTTALLSISKQPQAK